MLTFFYLFFCSLRIIGRTSSKDNSDHPLDTTESKMASAVPQEQQRAMSNKLSVSPFPEQFCFRFRRQKILYVMYKVIGVFIA